MALRPRFNCRGRTSWGRIRQARKPGFAERAAAGSAPGRLAVRYRSSSSRPNGPRTGSSPAGSLARGPISPGPHGAGLMRPLALYRASFLMASRNGRCFSRSGCTRRRWRGGDVNGEPSDAKLISSVGTGGLDFGRSARGNHSRSAKCLRNCIRPLSTCTCTRTPRRANATLRRRTRTIAP